MTHEEIKKWVRRNFARLTREFGLSWWRIEIVYEILEDCPAMISSHDEYEKSYLRIDPAAWKDRSEAEFADMIEHELLHITQAPYNSVHEIAAKMLSDEQNAVLDEAFRQAKERNVRHLERLVRQLRSNRR
jgi:hypothetical protein